MPVLRAQGKPREEKRNDVGRSMTLNSVFFCKLKNPLHTTRSRVDSLETVHWHNLSSISSHADRWATVNPSRRQEDSGCRTDAARMEM